MNHRQPSEHDKNDKTYIWAKLHNGTFIPDVKSLAGKNNNNSTKRKRGAPSDDIWGWTPGYYTYDGSNIINTTSADEKKVGEVQYQFILLGLDNSASSSDDDGQNSEHILSEEITNQLLQSGDVVLANAWEEYDFVNRLELNNADDNDDDESEYNYDQDSGTDDDDERGASFKLNILDEDKVDDCPPSNLIELTHLHEPSVVHALRHRYENTESDNQHCNIYTDTGPILLAVNPFKSDESGLLYGETTVQKYRVDGEKCWLNERREMLGGGGGSGNNTISDDVKEVDEETLPPHVYAVADRTFRTMMTRVHDISASATTTAATSKAKSSMPTQSDTTGDPKINQSVLVSGESGAGKTVTTKLLMAYLSKLSENPDSASTTDDNEEEVMSIEKRVLESNPIMESFGNARTIRNDNSSRFGKYIEMKFLSSVEKSNNIDHIPRATLVGASVETYLLEKVRLVHQSPGERNYHIFYELFCIKDEDIENQSAAEKLGLLDYEMEDFRLINQSDTYDRRDGVPDSETFSDLQSAMSIMGFTPDEINAVFQVTTALLHTSNLSFERIGEIECALIQDNPHLDYVVDLLGITKEALNSALCYYEITIGGNGGETHKRVLSMEQCEKGVEALIKATYGALFNYLVKRINMSVAGDKEGNASKARKSGQKEASIGILDIFGFESFQVNSFEQLCINYCNEALQQQFNRFVLRNEQEEYDKEGIPWTFIEFPENQDVLDLIALKGTGILNMLHDQCRTPGASDKTFALAMYEKCSTHNRFEADRRQVAEQLFAIQHYAGFVEYDIKGFVEKNRDELPKSGKDLLISSNKAFVKTLAEILQSNSTTNDTKKMSPRNGKAKRPTVGIQFSSQLHSLRRRIDDTSPHYIRCLKPNNLLLPNHFNAALIADQLRCAGVIEAVRVSRLGYPQRFSHNQFISRYRILGRKLKKKSNTSKKYNPAKALVHSIIQRLPDQQTADDIGIQVGKTKVFLRRQAYDLLEQLRRVRAADAAIIIQKIARGYVCRKLFVKTQHSLITLQCFARRILADRVVAAIRQQHNSLTIQRFFRAYLARKRYISAKTIARWCQTHHRGNVGRQAYNTLNREQNALYLQSRWRGYLARRSFRRKMHAVLTIQCVRRCQTARTELRARRNAARDLTAVVEERDRLKHEAAILRNELQKMKEGSHVEQVQHVVARHGSGSTEKETEIISLRTALNQLAMEKETADKELEKVTKMLAFVKSERDEAIQDRDDSRAVNKLLQTELNTREDELHSMKKDKSKGSSESQNAKIISTDTTQVLDLKSELKELREAYSNLQRANDQLKNENVSKRTTHIGERSPGVVPATTVCTSLTDMDMTEDTELARLREENSILQKQLELLRVNNEFQDIPDDQEYDESVAPTGSTVTEHIGDANVMPESVMQQICNEVETCTEQVIVKTRKESEANIAKLQAEIDELKKDTERSKRLANYDLDDMKRVNNSLRQDLEALEAEKVAIEEDLTLQIEEFDTLNEDVEQFAETFATQHEELEKAESLVKKLQSDNKNLKAFDEEKTKMIEELKSQIENREPSKQEWVGTEIERLWSEIGRLRETPASAEPIKGNRPSPDDTSSNEEETKEDSIEGSST